MIRLDVFSASCAHTTVHLATHPGDTDMLSAHRTTVTILTPSASCRYLLSSHNHACPFSTAYNSCSFNHILLFTFYERVFCAKSLFDEALDLPPKIICFI